MGPCISSGTRLHIPNSKLIKRRVRRDKENRGSLTTVFQTFIALLSGLKEGKYSTSVLNCNSIFFPKPIAVRSPFHSGRAEQTLGCLSEMSEQTHLRPFAKANYLINSIFPHYLWHHLRAQQAGFYMLNSSTPPLQPTGTIFHAALHCAYPVHSIPYCKVRTTVHLEHRLSLATFYQLMLQKKRIESLPRATTK